MRRSFVATLLSGSLAFQLVLAGAGSVCVMPASAATAQAGAVAALGTGMASMNMTTTGAREADTGDRAPAPPRGQRPASAPCDQSSPSAVCNVMAPCAGGVVTVAAPHEDAPAGASAAVASMVVKTPPSPTVAPELPPPRA